MRKRDFRFLIGLYIFLVIMAFAIGFNECSNSNQNKKAEMKKQEVSTIAKNAHRKTSQVRERVSSINKRVSSIKESTLKAKSILNKYNGSIPRSAKDSILHEVERIEALSSSIKLEADTITILTQSVNNDISRIEAKALEAIDSEEDMRKSKNRWKMIAISAVTILTIIVLL